jgi:cytochrome P450
VTLDTPELEFVSESDMKVLVGQYFFDDDFRAAATNFLETLASQHPVLDLGPMTIVSGYREITSLAARGALRTFPEIGGVRLRLSASDRLDQRFAAALPMRDGADHRRLQGVVQGVFSREGAHVLSSTIDGCVARRLEDARGQGEVDAVTVIAEPLPLDISMALLDVDQRHQPALETWAKRLKASFLAPEDGESAASLDQMLSEFDEVAESLLASATGGVLALLARAEAGGEIDHLESLAFVTLLIVNGLDTLTSALADTMFNLLCSPSKSIGSDVSVEHADAYFAEVLRFYSPVRFSARAVDDDVEVSGHRLSEGDVVGLFFAAANRDPRQFSDPGTFDADRPRARHLAYGHGAHQCIGRHVANLAGSSLVRRFSALGPRATLCTEIDRVKWNESLLYHSPQSLPIAVET